MQTYQENQLSNTAYQELTRILEANHTENDILLSPRSIPSNHAPHDLIAMWSSGASAQQLSTWYDNYMKMGSGFGPVLPITGEAHTINIKNWKEKLGADNWAGWISFFDKEHVRLGLDRLLFEYLHDGALGKNICGHLLHGLISIGYGLIANSTSVISEGLAQLAWKWQEGTTGAVYEDLWVMGAIEYQSDEISTVEDLLRCLEEMSADPRAKELLYRMNREQEQKREGDSEHDMTSSSDSSTNDSLAAFLCHYGSRFQTGYCITPPQILSACRVLYSLAYHLLYKGGSRDFLLLHFVTSAPALTALCLRMPSYALTMIRRWWLFLLSAYLKKGCPDYDKMEVSGSEATGKMEKDLDKLRSLAFQHNDEHVVKAVLVCIAPLEEKKQNYLDLDVDKKMEKMLLTMIDRLLKVPSPPKEKYGKDDWVYPKRVSPWATVY